MHRGLAKNAQCPELSIDKLWVPILCHHFEFVFSTGPVHSAEHLDINRCGYLCMNSLCVLIAVWLKATQRRRDGIQLNRCARELNTKLFEQA